MILYIAVTYDCNLRCVYCYARGGERKDYMSYSTAKKVVEKYYDRVSEVQFTGGEPLLNYKLVKRLVERYDLNFSLQTNATLLDEGKIEELSELGVSIAVSIDAPPEINDRLRPYADGRGSTKDVLRAMMLLKSYGIDYGVTCVVTPYNEKHLKEFIDIVYAFGAKSVSFDVVKPVGRGEKIPPPNTACIRETIRCSESRGYKLRFRNILKDLLKLECATIKRKAIFVDSTGRELFTCPTLAAAKMDPCPFKNRDV